MTREREGIERKRKGRKEMEGMGETQSPK